MSFSNETELAKAEARYYRERMALLRADEGRYEFTAHVRDRRRDGSYGVVLIQP